MIRPQVRARPFLYECRSFEYAAHWFKSLLICPSLQQLFSKRLCVDHPGMQWLLRQASRWHVERCRMMRYLMMLSYGVFFLAQLRPLGAMTGVYCVTLAESEQGGRGLDGDMVQTYDFRSVSGQPHAAFDQNGGLFDNPGSVKGLCLAALAGSEVTDPVRTRLAPQLMRHQSVASCTALEGTAAYSWAVLHLSAPFHTTPCRQQSSWLSVELVTAIVERSACHKLWLHRSARNMVFTCGA